MRKLALVTMIYLVSISAHADNKIESQNSSNQIYLNAQVDTGTDCLYQSVSMNFYNSSYSDSYGYQYYDQFVYVTVNTWDECNQKQTSLEGSDFLTQDEISIGDDGSVTIHNVTVQLYDTIAPDGVVSIVSFNGVVKIDDTGWRSWNSSDGGSRDPSWDYRSSDKSSSNSYNGIVNGEFRYNNTLLNDVYSSIYQREGSSRSSYKGDWSYPPGKG